MTRCPIWFNKKLDPQAPLNGTLKFVWTPLSCLRLSSSLTKYYLNSSKKKEPHRNKVFFANQFFFHFKWKRLFSFSSPFPSHQKWTKCNYRKDSHNETRSSLDGIIRTHGKEKHSFSAKEIKYSIFPFVSKELVLLRCFWSKQKKMCAPSIMYYFCCCYVAAVHFFMPPVT